MPSFQLSKYFDKKDEKKFLAFLAHAINAKIAKTKKA